MYSRINHYTAVVLYLIAAIMIIRQPLLGNFGYEYAAFFAVFASVIAGWNAVRDERRTGTITPAVRLRNGLVINIAYLIIPLIVVFLAALPGLPCDPLEGLAFYALLPVVSVIFAYPLGWLVSLLFRWGRITFLMFLIVWFFISALTAIVQPKIFFYNPFIGFFPGLSYDQLMPVTTTLLLYRGYTLFLALTVVSVIYMLRFTPIRDASFRDRIQLFRHSYAKSFLSIIVTIALILIFVQLLSRTTLGFSTTRSHLENSLGASFETRSFVIHYSPDSFDSTKIKWVAFEHEFQRHQAMNKLGVMNIGTIRSYLYPDPESKRSLIGPATTNIAKPWSKEIHINADDFQRSLLHELAHVVAGNFGMPVLRISNSISLLEGVAMATEGVWGNRTLHEHAAAILQFEIIRDPAGLLDTRGFTAHHSAASYVMMGSFVQYLIDRYGIHRVRSAYAWSDYESAFDRPREQLIREWIGFLNRINVSDRQKTKAMIHFKRPSLFGLECPRSLARLNRNARDYYAAEEYIRAERYFQRSWNMVHNGAALEGLLNTWFHLGEYEKVLEYVDDESMKEEFPQILPALYRVAGDIYAIEGDIEMAERFYRRLLAIDHSVNTNEGLWIRLFALDDPGDTDLWRLLYFERKDQKEILSSLIEKPHDEEISTGLQWMLARYLHMNGEYARSAAYHSTLRDRVDDEFLKYLTSMRIGESLFYAGKFQGAMAEFWNALNFTESPAAIHRLNEWIDRAQYAEEFGTLAWKDSPPW